MKKSLVLAMAMALGVTASAYAANPFSDVPAGHWAYDSISKLAAAGVIEGYGDDTFRGDRLMTRFEMAQIVAKAMSKGANVNKLAAEFADELDALGVRVAALEKKADNVKITGNIRYRWRLGSQVAPLNSKQRTHDLRTRLFINGQINDNWKYTGMLQNTQDFTDQANNGRNIALNRAYVTGRIGGVNVKLGRDDYELIGGDSDVYSDDFDGIMASYGDKLKITGWYGKPTGWWDDGLGAPFVAAIAPYGKLFGARLDYAMNNVGLYAEYDRFSAGTKTYVAGMNGNSTRDIFGIGADATFGDFGLNALYLHGKTKDVAGGKKNGFTVQVSYKGADAAKPGSWGLAAKYYDQGNHTYLYGTQGFDAFGNFTQADGFKGFRVSADYAFAKNIVGMLAYYDLKGKGVRAGKEKTAYSQLVFTF